MRVLPSGEIDCVVMHDTIALLAGKPSPDIDDNEIESILTQPKLVLDVALQSLQLEMLTEIAFEVDGARLVPTCASFPSAVDLRAWQVRNREHPAACEMPIRLRASLQPGARTLSVRFPESIGNVLLAVDRPGLQRTVFPLEPGLASPALDVTMATAERRADRVANASTPAPSEPVREPSNVEIAWRYAILGFHHIVPSGADHGLFVLGLFLLTPFARPLLWQVTAFTAAHSITLTLVALGLVSAPASIVEPAIALSIGFIAVENLFARSLRPWRLVVVFIFGLVHGLGFASGLLALDISKSQLTTGIIGFGVGVEAGHMAVLALAFALLGWTRRKPWYRARVEIPLSLAIATIAAWWAIERMVHVG